LLIIGGVQASFVVFLIVMDTVTEIDPHALPEITPAQLIDEFPSFITLLFVRL
jgi:hypothetical protein